MRSHNETERKHWAILGGGIMGITLAEKLVAAGQRVTILESASRLGGLASGWEIGGVRWDKFYHVILLSDSRLRATLARIGLEDQLRWVTTKTGFFSDGTLYSMSNSWEFLNFPPLSLIEKLRLGATIFYASKIKRWQKLEQIPVTTWLEKISGKGIFQKIWLPLLKAKLGTAYERTSAAFIWAYISRMYKARRSGLKTEMFGYVPGGYGRIMQALEQRMLDLGVELKLESAVSQIQKRECGQFDIRLENDQTLVFDRVIATVPAEHISRLCPQLSAAEHERFQSIEYLGVICVSMLLRESLSPYYVTNITDNWVPMTGVIEMSTVVEKSEFGGNSLVYLPKYLPATDAGLNESDDVIVDRFKDALKRMHPHFSDDMVLACKVARAKKVMAIPTLGYSQKLPPIRTTLKGFYALNSAHITSGTLNVNESIELAEKEFRQTIWPDFTDSNVPEATRPLQAH